MRADERSRTRERAPHALALECSFVHTRGNDEWGRALEARGHARHHVLNVPADRVFAHTALEPWQAQLQTSLVDCCARLEVVDAAQHQIHRRARGLAARPQPRDEVLKVLHQADVVRVRFELDVGIDGRQRLARCVGLGAACLCGREEQSIHVGKFHAVIVEE